LLEDIFHYNTRAQRQNYVIISCISEQDVKNRQNVVTLRAEDNKKLTAISPHLSWCE